VSDQLPSGKTFTVYRGVSGTTDVERRVLGYSWTLKSEVAKFFATYHRSPNPNVYTATINRKDVLAYLNASYRNEAEMLLKPDKLVNVRPIEVEAVAA
jgi:hypothetical protein